MCDYCDCRSHPEIAALSEDHELLMKMLGRLMRAVEGDDRDAAESVADELHELLPAHAAREERGVFVELRRADVPDQYVAMFEDDHHVVDALLDPSSRSDWREQARQLIRVLGEHILREETDLFPAAHQLLTPAQWDTVAAAHGSTASIG